MRDVYWMSQHDADLAKSFDRLHEMLDKLHDVLELQCGAFDRPSTGCWALLPWRSLSGRGPPSLPASKHAAGSCSGAAAAG